MQEDASEHKRDASGYAQSHATMLARAHAAGDLRCAYPLPSNPNNPTNPDIPNHPNPTTTIFTPPSLDSDEVVPSVFVGCYEAMYSSLVHLAFTLNPSNSLVN